MPVIIRVYEKTTESVLPQIALKEYLVYTHVGETLDPHDYIKSVTYNGVEYNVTSGEGTFAIDTSEMTPDEKADAVRENPLYGNVICRCEVITEAEIVSAVHRPVPALSIDAVKRRTRAGMGRCQGGFCSPRVAAIISREAGIPMEDITKNGGESYLLTGTLLRQAERSEKK